MPESWNMPASPSSLTPALDFLRRVEVWQQAPGGTAGIAVAMPEGDDVTLHELLNRLRDEGGGWSLESKARYWLIGYREMNPPLTPSQSAQLDAAIAGFPDEPVIRRAHRFRVHMSRRDILAGAVLILGLAGILGGSAIWNATHPDNPVQQGSQSQSQPQQVQPGTTDLQNFESDWGPFRQLAVSDQSPQTGTPALLLLNQGGYYAARSWTVPATAGWTADLGGNVQGADVHGHYADITDADGNPWVVGIGQPFVFARNPGTVLKIDPIGTVLAIPESHAIATRTHF
jgi:hypothetical protein